MVLLGVLPRDQMPDFWGKVDVACVPSLVEEAFGMVALEAMACGCPVVYTDRGALPEVVRPGGLLVRAGNHQQLAEALVRLLIDENLRRQLGALARRRAEEFSLDRRRRELQALIQEIWERMVSVSGPGFREAAAEDDRDGAGSATLGA